MLKKVSLSKLDNLVYTELSIQSYLKSEQFSVAEARMIYSFRTRMAPFRSNFKNLKETMCPLCATHLDDQNSLFQCPTIAKKFKQFNLSDIFRENIPTDLVNTLTQIVKLRNICLQ